MDIQEIQRRLEAVAAFRVSGKKCKDWAVAHGMSASALASWLASARHWQARLNGVKLSRSVKKPKPEGFIVAQLPVPSAPATTASVRIELSQGTRNPIELHWPLTHTRELGVWLREFHS